MRSDEFRDWLARVDALGAASRGVGCALRAFGAVCGCGGCRAWRGRRAALSALPGHGGGVHRPGAGVGATDARAAVARSTRRRARRCRVCIARSGGFRSARRFPRGRRCGRRLRAAALRCRRRFVGVTGFCGRWRRRRRSCGGSSRRTRHSFCTAARGRGNSTASRVVAAARRPAAACRASRFRSLWPPTAAAAMRARRCPR